MAREQREAVGEVSARRICLDCPSPISRENRGGRCRPCTLAALNADPEVRARRAVAMAALLASPEGRRRQLEGLRRANAKMSEREIERRRTYGREVGAVLLNRPEIRARSNAPEVRAKATATRIDTMLAWCPPEYRDQHRRNIYSKRLKAAESRRLIEAEIAAKATAATEKRAAARRAGAPRMTFDEQMARVMAGAQLVAKVQVRRPDPTMTLGGIASAAL